MSFSQRPDSPATIPLPPRHHLSPRLQPPCCAVAPLTHLRHQFLPKRPLPHAPPLEAYWLSIDIQCYHSSVSS